MIGPDLTRAMDSLAARVAGATPEQEAVLLDAIGGLLDVLDAVEGV